MLKRSPGDWRLRTLGTDCFVEASAVVVGHTIAGPYHREILSDEDYPEKLGDAHLVAGVPKMHRFISMVASLGMEWVDDDMIDRLIGEARVLFKEIGVEDESEPATPAG